MLSNKLPLLAITLALASLANAQEQPEQLPVGRTLVRIEAHPAKIQLRHAFDYSQLLLTGVLDNGERLDVTRLAKIEPTAPIVKVSPRGQVRPVKNGETSLRVAVAGKTLNIPVTISGQDQKYEVNFIREVMPALSKMGCNAGTCHGAAKGRNGFQLSLRGYDPVFDYRSLTDDIMARRFNRAAPEKSLMLMKPCGEVPHVGGVLTVPGDPYYEMIRSWIADGVKFDPKTPRVKSIEVYPPRITIPLPGFKQQIAVMASYTDGRRRDVSAEAFVESSNTEVATVDKNGVVTAVRRGQTAILVRYEGNYAAASLIVMGDRSRFIWQPVEPYNWIDALVYEKLKEMKIQPSDVCTDTEFMRRLHLDLTGLPPEPQEVRAFLNDPRPSRVKRDALVDKLVGSPEYVEHWTNKWADLLQVNSKFLGTQGAQAYREFIRKAIAGNMPYDQFARSILTASGSNLENPAAAYWKIHRDPTEAMETTTHLFLAVRFNCNKCHDHPFERWTQDQYYHLASFFAQVNRKEDPKFAGQKIGGTAVEGAKPLVEIISDTTTGEVKHDRTGEIVTPRFPFEHQDMPPLTSMPMRPGANKPEPTPRRQQLAHWITSPHNPYFARSYVNRLWSYLLGVGLIEPVDDIRAGNPPSNPKLLDRLTQEFITSKFDVQHLIRTICKSRTYQHSIVTNEWNQDDEINYSHALARRLPAEVLYDAIHRVTGSQSKLPGLPPGSRAAQIVDVNAPIPGGFLELLGRPPRESACECERSNSILLGPVLNLINGPVVAEALNDPNNRLAKLLAAEKDDAKVVEEIFLAILNRLPTPQELKLGVEQLRGREQEHHQMVVERERRLKALADYEKVLMARFPEYEANLRRLVPLWQPVEVLTFNASEATLKKLPDGSLLASGKIGYPEIYTVTARTNLKEVTAVRLEALTHPTLPRKGPGRSADSNFVLSEFRMASLSPQEPPSLANQFATQFLPGMWGRPPILPLLPWPKPIKLGRAQSSFNQGNFEVQKAIDGNIQTGWAISPQFSRPHQAIFDLKDKLMLTEGTVLTFTLEHHFNSKTHTLGRFRLSVTSTPTPFNLTQVPENIAAILHRPAEQRTPQDQAALLNYYRSQDQELPRLQRAVNEYQVPASPRGLGAQDLAWALINSRAFLFNH